MNKYEVMTNGEKIIVEAEAYVVEIGNILQFEIWPDEEVSIASFKDWSYVRKINE